VVIAINGNNIIKSSKWAKNKSFFQKKRYKHTDLSKNLLILAKFIKQQPSLLTKLSYSL